MPETYVTGANVLLDPSGEPIRQRMSGTAFYSEVPLGVSGVATTGWIDRMGFLSVMYVIQSAQAGFISAIEYSHDGITTNSVGAARTYEGNGKLLQITFTPKSRYLRITYTNGLVPQTDFYFEVILNTGLFQNTMASVFQPVTPTNLASLVTSVMQAQDALGAYDQVWRTGNSLNVNITNAAAISGGGGGLSPGQAIMANSSPVVIASNQSALPVTDNGGSLTIDGSVSVSSLPALPAGSNAIGKLSANDGVDIGDVTINNSSIAVTGTFWPATQPVSGTLTANIGTTNGLALDATAAAMSAKLPATLGAKTVANSMAVTIASDQPAVPVSLAALPALAAGAALIGKVGIDQTTNGTTNRVNIGTDGTVAINAALPAGGNTIGAVNQAGTWNINNITSLPALAAGANTIGHVNELRAATLCVTTTAAAGVAATLTIPAAVGQFHYITSIEVRLYSAAARTGAAAPVVVTTTNLPGSLAFTFDTAGAIGTSVVQSSAFATPFKSSASNTSTTIVAPVATGGIWRITVFYFTAT